MLFFLSDNTFLYEFLQQSLVLFDLWSQLMAILPHFLEQILISLSHDVKLSFQLSFLPIQLPQLLKK